MDYSIWAWAGFAGFILLMLGLDLGLFNRRARIITYRQATLLSMMWVALATLFAGLVFWQLGSQRGLEFVTAYLIELSLSVDNLFVFLLIFAYFKVSARYQHRVLFWGVLGALVMRVTFIFLGTTLLHSFQPIAYLFGAFLVYTGVRMFREPKIEVHPERNRIVRLVTRLVPIKRYYEGKKFFTRKNGRHAGTLLLLVLLIVEVTDLIFAADSIPAILAVTPSRFILYTSNVFAILGLRSLYFLLARVVEKFHYLKTGLSIVLTFIGVKMLAQDFLRVPIGIALGIVAAVLAASVAASFVWPPAGSGAMAPLADENPLSSLPTNEDKTPAEAARTSDYSAP